MAKDPAYLFYSQDFLVGTMTMSFEDKGKYITILCAMHQQGRMKEETIRFLVGNISDNLMSKFKRDENGYYYNDRLESEIEKRSKFVDSRRENGKKGGRRKKPIGYPKGKPTQNLHENENEIENKDIIKGDYFEKFWNEYDKKVGDKDKIKKKFIQLKVEDIEKIFIHIPKYKISQPDKKFRKDPSTYLNNKSWNDEIIVSSNLFSNTPEQPKGAAYTKEFKAE